MALEYPRNRRKVTLFALRRLIRESKTRSKMGIRAYPGVVDNSKSILKDAGVRTTICLRTPKE